jgi:hypothetical protein
MNGAGPVARPIPSASELSPAPTPSRRFASPRAERRNPFLYRLRMMATAGVMLLSACSPHQKLFADAPSHRTPQVVVLEPDALVIDSRHVRLANAAGPNDVPRAACWAGALAARSARETVRALIANAEDVTVTPTAGVDEDGRAWAQVSVDGVDLGQTLLQRGLAAPRNGTGFHWCAPISAVVGQGPPIGALAGQHD